MNKVHVNIHYSFFSHFRKIASHRSCAMSMNPKRDKKISNGKTQEPVIQVQTSRNLKNKIYLLEEVVFFIPNIVCNF